MAERGAENAYEKVERSYPPFGYVALEKEVPGPWASGGICRDLSELQDWSGTFVVDSLHTLVLRGKVILPGTPPFCAVIHLSPNFNDLISPGHF